MGWEWGRDKRIRRRRRRRRRRHTHTHTHIHTHTYTHTYTHTHSLSARVHETRAVSKREYPKFLSNLETHSLKHYQDKPILWD